MNHLDKFLETEPDPGLIHDTQMIRRHTLSPPTPIEGSSNPSSAERKRAERKRRAPNAIVDQLVAYFDAPWRNQAACKGKPTDWWIPTMAAVGHDYTDPRARAICADCPVKAECRDFAILNSERGYWGDTSERARRRTRQGAA